MRNRERQHVLEACKKGSVSVPRPHMGEYAHPYACYAPADDPKIVIAVMLELVPLHGSDAARIASKMIEHYFKRPAIQGSQLEGD